MRYPDIYCHMDSHKLPIIRKSATLLEANGNLTRMLEFITLGEEERKQFSQTSDLFIEDI
jgi:hypothetical protein